MSDSETDRWATTIELPLREPGLISKTMDLIRFLATSITFMVHLTNVRVFLDGHRIGSIEKSSVGSECITLPQEIKKSGNEIIMCIEEIEYHRRC